MKTSLWKPLQSIWSPCQDRSIDLWEVQADDQPEVLGNYTSILSVVTIVALNPDKRFMFYTDHHKDYFAFLGLGYLPREVFLRAMWLITYEGASALHIDDQLEIVEHYHKIIDNSVKGYAPEYYEWVWPLTNLTLVDITEPALFNRKDTHDDSSNPPTGLQSRPTDSHR